jgi:hypothetical protein
MHEQVGLWIDHRKAVVVTITAEGEKIQQIVSGMEKHVRFTNDSGSQNGSSEDTRDRQFGNHPNLDKPKPKRL